MRVAFAGTPAFAAQALQALADAGHEIPLVLTQPDRPAGRGLRMRPSAVSVAASGLGLHVATPSSLKGPEAAGILADARCEALVVVAYGLLLPASILAIPARGCLNIHASLLPRWRGAAPIQRALLAGDVVTGISIMQMDEGLDTGPVLLEAPLAIAERDTTATLHDRLAALGAATILAALKSLDTLIAKPQDESRATYAAKISKAEARIAWACSAAELDRRVRAFDPFPGAEARLGEEVVKVWAARPEPGRGEPGQVIAADDAGVLVACGEGALRLEQVQRPGGRRIRAAEFARSWGLSVGACLS
ncbi:MAG TPA: methionyl-tRNA formyltransferase [Usitatibacter sp.]|nr:methionyl-tRNA formyltransferase [Usitatibacter sp.]